MFHGFELTTDWKNSQCGQTACAVRGGVRYFIKRYQTPVMPVNNGALDAKTFAHNKELFDSFYNRRVKINTVIRSITGPGGNIVIPAAEFLDGNQYCEAAEFIDGAVDDEEVETILAGLSIETKQLLMQTAAGALASIHSKKIIHSDLKLKNVLLVRNPKTGNYVAKLIDFDSSYFIDDKPEEIVGTIEYYSPELGDYASTEDDLEEYAARITEKTDIFSLGLIFHQYLSGEMPTPATLNEKLKKRADKGKIIYCWTVLNNGCELQISPKIKDPKYVALISDMLSKDPAARPTAQEVLKRLKDTAPMMETPWPEDGIVLAKDKMAAGGVIGFRKSGPGKYEVLFATGRKEILDKAELLSRGFVNVEAPKEFAAPWPEHAIRLDEAKLNSRGFVSCKQDTLGGVKGYQFYRADGSSQFFKVEMLLAMKYAVSSGSAPASAPAPAKPVAPAPAPEKPVAPTPAPEPTPEPVKPVGSVPDGPKEEPASSDIGKITYGGGKSDFKKSFSASSSASSAPTPAPEPVKPTPEPAPVASGICSPWPEHAIAFDEGMVSVKGYVAVEQAVLGGVNGYNFVKADGSKQFIRVEMVLIQKLAKRI